VIGSAFGLSGCQSGVLDPQGLIGAAERTILLNSLVIMLAIVVPTILATLAFAWWFRSSNSKARYRPNWAYSGRIELVVWSIPTLVILFLGGITWIGSHDLDPARPLNSQSTHCRSKSYRSTGNGCSSTRIRVSLSSISLSFRSEHPFISRSRRAAS
jgi:cytochrome o ubiquinol oxidase subunit 2